MKKLFQLFALICIVICCFIYSEKTMLVVREYDDIMIKIRKIAKEKKVKPIEAVVTKETIIPGMSGLEVDINKSYLKMKQYGKYKEELLVYKKIKPKEQLINNKGKYIISGNTSRKMVSLILLINNKYIKKINSKTILNYFIDNPVSDYSRIKGYSKYDDWLKSTLKANKINLKYCLDKKCLKNFYVIKSNIIKNNHLLNTKKELNNGSIIIYQVNNSFIKELNLIVNYIESKGYQIVDLDTLLED